MTAKGQIRPWCSIGGDDSLPPIASVPGGMYHQKDTGYYCGAACAQRVLDECGVGLLDQDTLYNDNYSHSRTRLRNELVDGARRD